MLNVTQGFNPEPPLSKIWTFNRHAKKALIYSRQTDPVLTILTLNWLDSPCWRMVTSAGICIWSDELISIHLGKLGGLYCVRWARWVWPKEMTDECLRKCIKFVAATKSFLLPRGSHQPPEEDEHPQSLQHQELPSTQSRFVNQNTHVSLVRNQD